MVRKLLQMLQALVCIVLVAQLVSCGTLMYPERRGQRGGHIDVGVAVLDGIGLLFFLVPGIIAYAIDFSNGTIYLPGGSASSQDIKHMKQVKFDPKHYTVASLEKIIKRETGHAVKMSQGNIEVYRLKSLDDMMARFAEVLPRIQSSRVALNVE